jgi:hypothetical protein
MLNGGLALLRAEAAPGIRADFASSPSLTGPLPKLWANNRRRLTGPRGRQNRSAGGCSTRLNEPEAIHVW